MAREDFREDFPYHSQYGRDMSPSYFGPRPRPRPYPRSLRQKWRDRVIFLIGAAIIIPAVMTLFLDDPDPALNKDIPEFGFSFPSPSTDRATDGLGDESDLMDAPPPEESIPSMEEIPGEEMPMEEIPAEEIPAEGFSEEMVPFSQPPLEAVEEDVTIASPIISITPDSNIVDERSIPDTAYVLQLTSQRTRAGSEQYYARLRDEHPDLFLDQPHFIEQIYLADRGTFYRLHLYPFGSRREAQDLCVVLKNRGLDCLVKKR